MVKNQGLRVAEKALRNRSSNRQVAPFESVLKRRTWPEENFILQAVGVRAWALRGSTSGTDWMALLKKEEKESFEHLMHELNFIRPRSRREIASSGQLKTLRFDATLTAGRVIGGHVKGFQEGARPQPPPGRLPAGRMN